jgi:hypothetical protein
VEILKTKRLLIGIIVVVLSALPFAECQVAEANIYVMVDQPFWRTVEVNQPTEFLAHGSGGTPPYTFQWYTTFLDPNIEHRITVPVPNSNSSTFKFAESTLGRYGISVRISDSNGNSEYQSFQPIGIVVTVQSSPVAQPSTTPSPSPTTIPTDDLLPTPSIPEITNTLAVSLLVVIPTIVLIFLRRNSRPKP